jgi:uncharacterized secreted protein with C-terminal beta-propeller domain
LGIGQAADHEGRVTGMALSLFDVRDISAPKLAHKIALGKEGSSSEAQYDHHAFRYIPETGQLVIPVQLMEENYSPGFEGFRIYGVSIEDGFQLAGQSAFPSGAYGYYNSRTFFHDGVIAMVGGGEMVLRNSAQPTADVARVPL